jgi:penicillin-insensitive murein endopeptidase
LAGFVCVSFFVVAAFFFVDGTRSLPATTEQVTRSGRIVSAQVLHSAAIPNAGDRLAPSQCHGRVGNGRLEGGIRLPARGSNFQAYSGVGVALGRTYVHHQVFTILLAAYADLAENHPELQFVYGETGWQNGGRFRPHRTHQRGTSVDLMVPVRRRNGDAIDVLPTSVFNGWGYRIDFDDNGVWEEYRIDWEAYAVYLAAISRAARQLGSGIEKLIIYPKYRMHLEKTRAWSQIAGLPFSRKEAWVRHDEHMHLDFAIKCASK